MPRTVTWLRERENLSARLQALLRLYAEVFEIYGWEYEATQERFRNDLDDVPEGYSPPIAPL
jgi:hypothetical protein